MFSLRKRMGLSLQQLGERSDVSAAAIHKIEQGGMVPTITTLLKIAGALGRPVSYFVEEDIGRDDVAVLTPPDEDRPVYTSHKGIRTAPFPAEPLAVEQVSAGEIRSVPGAGEPLDGLAVEALGGAAVAEQRTRAGLDPQPEVGASGLRRFGQPRHRPGREAGVSAAHSGFDQLGQGPQRDVHSCVLAGLRGRGQCLLILAQAVVQNRGDPIRVAHGQALPASRRPGDRGLDQRDGFGLTAAQAGEFDVSSYETAADNQLETNDLFNYLNGAANNQTQLAEQSNNIIAQLGGGRLQ